ncbi:hypothetical protein EV126DRAFT_415553 [Verticillium dahliae]|nr:hypothetical protein EV126DRAFT_415553 [Verticillium dahliae]
MKLLFLITTFASIGTCSNTEMCHATLPTGKPNCAYGGQDWNTCVDRCHSSCSMNVRECYYHSTPNGDFDCYCDFINPDRRKGGKGKKTP